MFLIRAATLADAPSLKVLLTQLEHPLTEREVRDKINYYNQPSYQLLVLEFDGRLAGFISLHWYDVFYKAEPVGRITALCVDQQYRSQGIGSKLVKAAEEYFTGQGCYRVEVSSNARRSDAHRFYLQNGYIINSKRFIKELLPQSG